MFLKRRNLWHKEKVIVRHGLKAQFDESSVVLVDILTAETQSGANGRPNGIAI
jgi:hypothetical protein